MADAASYDYSYAHSTGSLSPEPQMNAINHTSTETTAPHRSQNTHISPIAVKSAPLEPSNWLLFKVFLIIVSSVVIGCVVYGAVINLWASQPRELANLSEDLPGIPRDCTEVKARGNVVSGQYMISPHNGKGLFPVYCDMDTDGGGWTVFQRQEDGSVDFFLNWIDYENGFGNVYSEHWLGNKKIHDITTQGRYELRIDISDFYGYKIHVKYDYFRLGNADTQYKLILGSYSRSFEDECLTLQDNQAFSTKDRDNDKFEGGSCANEAKGAWWYGECLDSSLNRVYVESPHEFAGIELNCVQSGDRPGYNFFVKQVEMKIRMIPFDTQPEDYYE